MRYSFVNVAWFWEQFPVLRIPLNCEWLCWQKKMRNCFKKIVIRGAFAASREKSVEKSDHGELFSWGIQTAPCASFVFIAGWESAHPTNTLIRLSNELNEKINEHFRWNRYIFQQSWFCVAQTKEYTVFTPNSYFNLTANTFKIMMSKVLSFDLFSNQHYGSIKWHSDFSNCVKMFQ